MYRDNTKVIAIDVYKRQDQDAASDRVIKSMAGRE